MNNHKIRKILFKFYRVLRNPKSVIVLFQLLKFKKLSDKKRGFKISPLDLYPITNERTKTTHFDRHYVYHTSWAARVVREINPDFHTDISSSLFFAGIVSAFTPIKFYDYRPADLILSDLETHPGDLCNLPFESNSLSSLSCMHTIEHVGIGRYGDPVGPNDDIKAVNELKRVVKKEGSLLIVVPIGKTPRIEYNAHRIYSYDQIISMVCDEQFELKEFAFIPERDEQGGLVRYAKKEDIKDSYYACGCFWFIKK